MNARGGGADRAADHLQDARAVLARRDGMVASGLQLGASELVHPMVRQWQWTPMAFAAGSKLVAPGNMHPTVTGSHAPAGVLSHFE